MDYAKLSRTELLERLRALDPQAASSEPSGVSGDDVGIAEAARQESAERLRAILETAVEGIITIDERGLMESLNPAAEKIFGYSSSELVGRNISLLMPSPYREEHDVYMANYARSGMAKIIGIGREVVGQRKNGTVFPLDLSVSEVRLAKRRLFTGFVRDITERKHLENEVLRASEAEQRRIGHDLHDGICQYLAGIELMTRVLQQNLEKKSKTQGDQAGKIAEHMRAAVAQARMLARGLSPVVLESDGLMSALRELAVTAEKLFQVVCHFHCPVLVLVSDHAMATHLYRIAQEAVNNAVKHGRATSIDLSLTLGAGILSLEVRDNGNGLPTGPPAPGGMGLRIMRYRAGTVGGTLVVRANPDRGATVVCSLPHLQKNAGAPREKQ